MRSAAGRRFIEPARDRSRAWSVVLCLTVVAGLLLVPAASAGATSFVVTDPGDAGPGTLRQAILDANANPGADTITFNIGSGGGAIAQTIVPVSPLPAITDQTTVDGLSQPGSSCTGWPPTLLIRIDGSKAGAGAAGLTVADGAGTTIRGLTVRRFGGDGISLSAPATATTITCNSIGTSANGTSALGNGGAGIAVRSTGAASSDTSITNNVIMDNAGAGVVVDAPARLVSIRANRIDSNGGVGIDLVPTGGADDGDGPTPNAVSGQGLGGNDLRFTPDLTSATSDGSGTTVSGSLTTHALSTAAGEYVIDLYAVPVCDVSPGGFGEGAVPIGTTTIPGSDASAPGTFAFSVAGLPAVSIGAFVTATATDAAGSGNTSEFSGCAQVVQPTTGPSADLSVSGGVAPDPATGGASVTYTLTVHDAGPDLAEDVTLTDDLPAGLQAASASASAGSCSVTVPAVSCALGTVSAGPSNDVQVTITATTDDVTSALTLDDQASVTSTTTDPDATNDAVTISSTVQPRQVDLSITKSGPAEVTEGDAFPYSIHVANAGPDAAHAVTVTDQLPAGVSFVDATPSAGACHVDAGTLSCALGALGPGGTGSVEIDVHADRLIGTTPLVLSNVASVASDRPDLQPADDTSATVLTTVRPAAADPDLELTSVANVPNPVTGGYDLGYTATVTNLGPGDASGVTLADTLAAGETFVVAGSSASCTASAGVVMCAIGQLADGAAATIQIVTRTPVVAADTPMKDAFVVSSPQDDTSANDAATITTTVRPRRADFAAAYVPPSNGPTWITDATMWSHGDPVASTADPTVVEVGIPGGGPGGPVTITERPCAAPFVCAIRRSTNGGFFPAPGGTFGSLVSISVPRGYPASSPFGAVVTDDWSAVGWSWNGFRVSYQDGPTGAFTPQLPVCFGWRHGTPPCVAGIARRFSWWNPWGFGDLRAAVSFTGDGTFGLGR